MNPQAKQDVLNALELLNKAAKEEKQEIQQMISEKYTDLRSALNEGKGRLAEKLSHSYETMETGFNTINTQVKTNPWPYIGAIALTSFIVGVAISHNGRR
jgi:ElaB/YqjD/DUF883 family membrane-anchored ribosome-binding protein